MIYFFDSTIQQWDLESGEIIREQKPSRNSALTAQCACDLPHDTLYCCIADGSLRIINMATGSVMSEFSVALFTCNARVNGSMVYTASPDGLIKRFDLSGNLLSTYDAALGYATILGFDHEFLFTSHYSINGDGKTQTIRWNHLTGESEQFPVPTRCLSGPISDLKEYYFCFDEVVSGLQYIRVFKSNLSMAETRIVSFTANLSEDTYEIGNRIFHRAHNSIFELRITEDGVKLSKRKSVEDYTHPTFEFLALNQTTMIVVYVNQANLSFYSKFLDLETGIFSGRVPMFDDHTQFQVSGKLLLAAVGQEVAAYHLHNLTLAWKSPPIAPESIWVLKYQEGCFYYRTQNFVGYSSASSFQPLGMLSLVGKTNSYSQFSKGVFFGDYGWNSVAAFDISDGSPLRQYAGMNSGITLVLLDGDDLYVGSVDNNIHKFDFESAARILVFIGHSGAIRSLLTRGQLLFSAADDFTIRRWNTDTGESLYTYFGHNERIWQLYIYDYTLYSLTRTEIRSWDLTRERLRATYFDKSAVPIALYATGKDLVSCSIGGSFTLWNWETGLKAADLYSLEDNSLITGVINFNSSLIFSTSKGSIMRFNYLSDEIVTQISGGVVEDLSAFFIQKELLYSFGKNEGLLLKNITDQTVRKFETSSFHANALLVVGDFLFSANNDTTISKFDAKTLAIVKTIKAHTGSVTVLGQFENQLVSGSEDNSLRTWDVESLNLVSDLRRDSTRLGHLGSITSIYFEGNNLFSGSADTTVKRWNLNTGRVTFTYTGHSKRVRRVHVNNRTLCTTGEDESIQLYNVDIAPIGVLTTSITATTVASRRPPIISGEPQESSTISAAIIGIIIGAVLILILALGASCRMLSAKYSGTYESPTLAITTDLEPKNNTALQEMTLAPTNVGISIPASKMVKEQDFVLAGLLGRGGGGDVSFATPTSNTLRKYGDRIVAKRIKKKYSAMSPNEKAMFDQEIGIMEMLGGRGHFVELLGYSLNPCTILMKLYSLGSLTSFIEKMRAIWSKVLILSFVEDIFVAVGIMHRLELAHCDLKADNILIDRTEFGRYICVLTDFGITQILSESIIDAKAFNSFNVRGLSARYAAPEAFIRFKRKLEFSSAEELKAGDVFSLAATLYEMITKKAPWS